MNCDDWKKQFEAISDRWSASLSGDIQEPTEEMVDHARQCRQCGLQLEAFERLTGRKAWDCDELAWLSGRIDAKIRSRTRAPLRGKIPSFAMLMAFLFLTAGLSVQFFLPDSVDKTASAIDGTVVVRFVLEAPSARNVSVVGDWNGWNPEEDPLRLNRKEGIWELEIPLSPGKEYRYQFFIDDKVWTPDPKSILQVDDGFGSVNSILEI